VESQQQLANKIEELKNEDDEEMKLELEEEIEEMKADKKKKRNKNSRGGKKVVGQKKASGPKKKNKKNRMASTEEGDSVQVKCTNCPRTKFVNNYKDGKLITPNHVKKDSDGKSVHCGVYQPLDASVVTVTKKVLK
jgi:hypothetical protein